MASYKQKLEMLQNDVELIIQTNTPFEVTNEDLQFNLEYGLYLTNITRDHLIDNRGYQYSINVLPIEKLVQIADWLQTKK